MNNIDLQTPTGRIVIPRKCRGPDYSPEVGFPPLIAPQLCSGNLGGFRVSEATGIFLLYTPYGRMGASMPVTQQTGNSVPVMEAEGDLQTPDGVADC